MKMWAWSWHTPLPSASASAAPVWVSVAPGIVLDPVAHAAEQGMQPVQRVLAVHGRRQGVDGCIRLGLRRLLEEHARRRALGKAGDDAVAVLRLDRAARLDHQLLVAGIDGDQMHDVAEPVPELQRRPGAARAHLPVEHALTLEGGGRQPQALDGVGDRLRVPVACDVANRDQHRSSVLIATFVSFSIITLGPVDGFDQGEAAGQRDE